MRSRVSSGVSGHACARWAWASLAAYPTASPRLSGQMYDLKGPPKLSVPFGCSGFLPRTTRAAALVTHGDAVLTRPLPMQAASVDTSNQRCCARREGQKAPQPAPKWNQQLERAFLESVDAARKSVPIAFRTTMGMKMGIRSLRQ